MTTNSPEELADFDCEDEDALDPRVAAARAEDIADLQLIQAQPTEPNPHLEAIPVRLYNASRECARRALARFTLDYEADRLEAAILAGAAAEYLLRAVVAAHDPLLLADKHTASQVALSRANTSAPVDLRATRTLGTIQVLDILRTIHPSMNLEADMRFVMDHRNSAAHLALVDAASLNELMVRLVQVVARLHLLLARREEHYWGVDLANVVISMKSERASQIQQTVQAKYANARVFLEDIVGGLSLAGREAVLEARETRPTRWGVLDARAEPTECPVCARTGWTDYVEEREESELPPESEADGRYETAVYSIAVMFQCPVCGLVLDANEIGFLPSVPPIEVSYEPTRDPHAG